RQVAYRDPARFVPFASVHIPVNMVTSFNNMDIDRSATRTVDQRIDVLDRQILEFVSKSGIGQEPTSIVARAT
ncbi:hypothetical protein, partial [Herbaspirillum lusitanum]|uniref:hypothetical protein n=1 Tax=Herbaspirillum lusitanum TaxID=213312 RepID=UPI001EE67FEA